VTYVKKEGGIQNALAWTLYDIREKNYMHFNVTGPVPFPTISRLLHKAH
jgi:tryptophan synthase beta subunit